MKNKKKILVIDDEADFTKLIRLNLEQTGKFEVRTENRGAAALAAAKAFRPDLVLLDILMPDLMGSEVAAQMKEDDDTKDIPVVFLTAVVGKEEVVQRGGVIGGHLFVAKPVDIKQLIEVIDENIR
ncbi:MAG: response regulator [Candidatus Omnitrophica bacterium]|nr:response regulator [Candidatus Omnitrophota bacterium]MDD5137775.1 response regulator [Candidatus Omnitrophota bacterium]